MSAGDGDAALVETEDIHIPAFMISRRDGERLSQIYSILQSEGHMCALHDTFDSYDVTTLHNNFTVNLNTFVS